MKPLKIKIIAVVIFISFIYLPVKSNYAGTNLNWWYKRVLSNVQMHNQERGNWCWAAVAQSKILYRTNVLVSQSAIVAFVKGSPPPDERGSAAEVKTVLSIFGPVFVIPYSAFPVHYPYPILTKQLLKSLIDRNEPFYYGFSSHARLVYGYQLAITPGLDSWVAFMDPMPFYPDPYWLSWNEYINEITGEQSIIYYNN